MYDFINAFSVVEMIDGELTGNVFTRRVRPSAKLKVSVEAMQVQGLDLESDSFDPEELVTKLTAQLSHLFAVNSISALQAATELQDWTTEKGLNRVPVVAHHASFDHAFYNDKLNNTRAKAIIGHALSPVWICTKTLACHVWPDKHKKDLNSCLVATGISPRESLGHDAAEDAVKCGQLYFALRGLLNA
jgi:DNA polymerase III epsilon subunit-like protein